MLELLNNFIRTRLTVKSRDCNTLMSNLSGLGRNIITHRPRACNAYTWTQMTAPRGYRSSTVPLLPQNRDHFLQLRP